MAIPHLETSTRLVFHCRWSTRIAPTYCHQIMIIRIAWLISVGIYTTGAAIKTYRLNKLNIFTSAALDRDINLL